MRQLHACCGRGVRVAVAPGVRKRGRRPCSGTGPQAPDLDLNREHLMSIYKSSGPESLCRTLSEVSALISEKRDTSEAWYVKATRYATGDVDTVAVRLAHDQSINRGGAKGRERKHSDKAEMDEATLAKSRSRARRTVRSRLLMMQADRMLTLTYRENVTDIEQAWRDFGKFNRVMKWRFKDRWQYVCVPERQERGAIHFHLAIRGYFPVNTVRRFWRDVVGEGNIDITSPRAHGKASWNPKRIAHYLTKYITKNDTVGFNRRRYSASTNIEAPEVRRGFTGCGLPMVALLRQVIERLTRMPPDVRTHYEGDGLFRVVCLST